MSGLIIFPIFILYVVVGFFVLNFLFSLFKWNIKKYIIVIIVILLPFWDLFIQKGIKTYYQILAPEIIIYHYPEINNNGKIESFFTEVNSLSHSELLNNNGLYRHYSKYIDKYILFYEASRQSNKKNKILKFDLLNKTYITTSEMSAKYSIRKTSQANTLFGLYKKQKSEFFDTNTNIVLAETFNIVFESKYSYFRENILLLLTGTGQPIFYVTSLNQYTNVDENRLLTKLIKQGNINE